MNENPSTGGNAAPQQSGGTQTAPGYYTPGHARRKLMLALWGCVLMGIGISQMWTPLTLLLFGERTTAEATRVIKTRPGAPDLVLTNDAEIRDKEETHDRNSIFWNEFRFQDTTGKDRTVRAPIGSQLKPLYPIIDADGLPTTLPIHYKAHQPDVISFPTIFSTWYAPGLLFFVGLGALIAGSILYYWADKPIELPHLHS